MQHLTSLQFDLIIIATLLMGMAIGVFFTSWWYTKPKKKHPERPISFDEADIYTNAIEELSLLQENLRKARKELYKMF